MPVPATVPAVAPPPPALVRPTEADGGWITPGGVWPDTDGHHVQAHGGDVIRVGDRFYWFGEERSRDTPPGHKRVGCYSSADLMTWTRHRPALDMAAPDGIGSPWVLERPKVYANARTGKFVMYAHVDDRSYHLAEVGVFVSDAVDGPYTFVRRFRPLGQESRDIGQFVDDDGTAYLIFEARPTKGFYIAKLSDDYLTVAEQTCFIPERMEGGAVVHYDGLYYCVASYMTGWAPNANRYATATSPAGPWSAFRDVAPPKEKTYGSQSAFLLKVHGSRRTDVIFVGDQWRPKAQWDSRYLWMPLQIGGGQLTLPPPRPWRIDVDTGVVTFK